MGFVLLLAIAMAVAIVARRLRLPYTVGLVLVGVGIALAKVEIGAALTHDFIFYVILPPLLFEAALALRWDELRENGVLILVLSTIGTVLAAIVVVLGAVYVMHWTLPAACVFGALIAATDPVAVIAMFKDNDVHGRLRTLLESESLFNDAVAAILFSLALTFAVSGAPPSFAGASLHLGYAVGIGALVGAGCGGFALIAAGQTREHVVEVALTVLAAYGAFLGAEALGGSGILATVIAGLVIGNVGVLAKTDLMSRRAKQFAQEFWEFAAFLANSAVFPLIGLAVGAANYEPRLALALLFAVVLTPLSRAATIYPLSLVFSRTRAAVPQAHQHVLWWGGLRGALALALALSLPESLADRDDIILTTFAVVAFSIIVQGLTMPLLLRRLGIVRSDKGA